MSLLFESLGQLSDHLAGSGVQVVDPGVPLETLTFAKGDLWAQQPSVRKVVGFVARNVASIPLHVYERVSDGDRQRVTDHELARLAKSPAPRTSAYRFWEPVLIDWLLHDRWCVRKVPTQYGRTDLVRLPVRTWKLRADGLDRVVAVQTWDGQQWIDNEPDGFLYDHGYARVGANGTSPAETLKALLAEAAEAVAYRRGVWANGARVPAVIERPIGAPPWTTEAKFRFRQSWQNFVRGGGREGGTPILEDGMKLVESKAYSPQDAQDLEGRKLTDIEVATAYFIAPELLGIREGTFSNVESFRQSLYRDALGPYIDGWIGTINAQLTPDLSDGRDLYVEAHVEAKLRGSFEEQAQVLSTSVGAPWMLRSEARARMNLPHIEHTEELVTPLNVVVGGLASPRDTGDQNRGAASRDVKSKAMEEGLSTFSRERDALESDLADYQTQLAETVLSGLGAKAAGPLDEAFNLEVADAELRRLLHGRSRRIAQVGALSVLTIWNPSHEGWNPDVMDAWLARAAESNASRMNRGLYDRLAGVVTDADWQVRASGILGAVGWASESAVTLATEAASFGRQDAATASGLTTKTWQTTSGNPRPSHAWINGETVGIDGVFSNNARWPGDWRAGADEVAGCQCELVYGTGEA